MSTSGSIPKSFTPVNANVTVPISEPSAELEGSEDAALPETTSAEEPNTKKSRAKVAPKKTEANNDGIAKEGSTPAKNPRAKRAPKLDADGNVIKATRKPSAATLKKKAEAAASAVGTSEAAEHGAKSDVEGQVSDEDKTLVKAKTPRKSVASATKKKSAPAAPESGGEDKAVDDDKTPVKAKTIRNAPAAVLKMKDDVKAAKGANSGAEGEATPRKTTSRKATPKRKEEEADEENIKETAIDNEDGAVNRLAANDENMKEASVEVDEGYGTNAEAVTKGKGRANKVDDDCTEDKKVEKTPEPGTTADEIATPKADNTKKTTTPASTKRAAAEDATGSPAPKKARTKAAGPKTPRKSTAAATPKKATMPKTSIDTDKDGLPALSTEDRLMFEMKADGKGWDVIAEAFKEAGGAVGKAKDGGKDFCRKRYAKLVADRAEFTDAEVSATPHNVESLDTHLLI